MRIIVTNICNKFNTPITKGIQVVSIDKNQWINVNNRLNAKIISELHYEEVIFPKAHNGSWRWKIDGIVWQFKAEVHIWGNIIIDEYSVTRNGMTDIPTTQLLKDIAVSISLDDIILGNLLEEIQQTLYADLRSQSRISRYSREQLIQLSGVELQAILNGHPKAIANKGRLGWGVNELTLYSPESAIPFQLNYLAVAKSLANAGIEQTHAQEHEKTALALLSQMMSEEEQVLLLERLAEQKASIDDYWIIPAHPWQFSHFIVPQFAALFADKAIIDLGVAGDQFQPQQSIRTLSNVSRPANNDIKLPVTILNTSCYRGIPGKYITTGAALSRFIHQLCQDDPFLAHCGLQVLKEWAGIHIPHPAQESIKDTPYRYNEMLGAIWRDSCSSVLRTDQQDKLAAVLMQTDSNGRSLITQYINDSGLSVEAWLTRLFDSTVIPLYHLMCQYGIALVSHGQNLTLIMEDNIPVGVAIKDFHGDLRIIDEDFPELTELPLEIKNALTRLPAKYLIHDLFTGHFVTVLRFVSPHLKAEMDYPETDFYCLLANRIIHYQSQFPEMKERFNKFDLLSPTMEKICINRVRFKVGYQDTSERLLPELGAPLHNPLFCAPPEKA